MIIMLIFPPRAPLLLLFLVRPHSLIGYYRTLLSFRSSNYCHNDVGISKKGQCYPLFDTSAHLVVGNTVIAVVKLDKRRGMSINSS